jgi:Uma2 family endonuclease
MPAASRKLATVDDLFAIPEEERRHELIEGVIVPKGAATGEHGGAQAKLSEYVGPFHRRPGGRAPGGWWFGTEVDIYFDPKNTFRPDIVGWRRDRVPQRPSGALVTIRPDWICEILSTNRSNDRIKKKRVYHRHEVPHYWLLDPEGGELTVYRWAPEGYLEILVAERSEVVRPEPFEAIPVRVSTLLGEDEDEEEEPTEAG